MHTLSIELHALDMDSRHSPRFDSASGCCSQGVVHPLLVAALLANLPPWLQLLQTSSCGYVKPQAWTQNLFSFDATADEFKGIGHTDGVIHG
jgi:hypothetical protein